MLEIYRELINSGEDIYRGEGIHGSVRWEQRSRHGLRIDSVYGQSKIYDIPGVKVDSWERDEPTPEDTPATPKPKPAAKQSQTKGKKK